MLVAAFLILVIAVSLLFGMVLVDTGALLSTRVLHIWTGGEPVGGG